jgi:hypothetical protein
VDDGADAAAVGGRGQLEKPEPIEQRCSNVSHAGGRSADKSELRTARQKAAVARNVVCSHREADLQGENKGREEG